MRIGHRAFTAAASFLLIAGGMQACGGLAHAINDDGSDITNPNGTNPGSRILTLSADRTDLGVGDVQEIVVRYAGATLLNNQPVNADISDSAVIAGSAFGARATSVGGATITATYQGSTATLGFSVHAQYGLSAIVGTPFNTLTGTAVFSPASIVVLAGSTVEFHLQNGGLSHNVVFDTVPGAPDDIAAGAQGAGLDRRFATPGVFRYQCTVHGETGVVNVVAP